jgi:UDP-N-acetylglucosamine--dolichyl-phosphate N-acetylglucosaminephosphotransferase
LLYTSKAEFKLSELKPIGKAVLALFRFLRLISYAEKTIDGEVHVEVSNFTVVNLVIHILGPTHEESLTVWMLALQMAFSVVAFYIRYRVALWFFEGHDLTEAEISARYAGTTMGSFV